jgi:long-chain acyl-CoA synthetase
MKCSKIIVRATIEKKDVMTEEDEDILFGDEAYVPVSSVYRPKSRSGSIFPDPSHPPNPLDHVSSDPLIGKLHTMRDTLRNCPQLWTELSRNCGDKRALLDEHMCDDKVDVTFAEMNTIVRKSAAVFQSLGVKPGVNVAILGENSARWLMVDHGIQMAGGASAVRGADAPLDELRYIYEQSDSAGIVVVQGPKLLEKLASDASAKGMHRLGLSNEAYGKVHTVILMHREKKTSEELTKMVDKYGLTVRVFADLLEEVQPVTDEQIPVLGRDDLATIVYTSGTTGRPKGVMLTHGNLIHQIGHRVGTETRYDESEPLPDETMLSLLPVWHITERSFELWMLARGCNVVYSSIRTFKNDLAKHRPEWAVLVPRVLEKIATGVQDKFSSGSLPVKLLSKLFTSTSKAAAKHRKITQGYVVGEQPPGAMEKLASRALLVALSPLNAVGNKIVWSKVQNGFGGRMRTIMSGGSALSGSLEEFYEAAGLTIIVAYGLTECAPLISHRRRDANLVTGGCVGTACIDTELRVVSPESKASTTPRPALPAGEVGVVIARGPQIMKGYYKDVAETKKAIDQFGFFDTGDLGRVNPATGDLILTGRAKDTIVLSNGENVEPGPLEDAILGELSLIEQVMLTGQDGRKLTAIVVLSPSELANEGFLSKDEGALMQKRNEQVNDPKCSAKDCQDNVAALNQGSKILRTNKDLIARLVGDCKKATKRFQKWEQVKDVCVTLEPFAMANGQLTQSYKVKRPFVLERYEDELSK